MSDTPKPPDTAPTGLADTAVPSQVSKGEPSRSPSQKVLKRQVKAAIFDGAPTSQTAVESGTVLGGRFRIAGLLGRGGMGEVYRARDLVLDEDIALKFLPTSLAHDERFMDRFVQEVRIARQVTHPNVCRVHDIGEVDGRTYLSMEYIDGEDLASLLRRIGRLPLEKATELAQQLCTGLAALHDAGVLHRDLKPHNLMVDGRGDLKITDFGLAADADELRAHEFRDGTPAYMAPEQAAGEGVTVRSDLFALGLILFEILTGRRAREAAAASGLDAESKLTTNLSGIPREVDEVIQACLQEDPRARPSSALAVAAALPGGDPVAAAMAAGATPSVDALLRSSGARTLPRWAAMTLIGLAVSSLILLAATFESSTFMGRGAQQSPEVLRHVARELLDEVVGPEDRAVEFHTRALLAPAFTTPKDTTEDPRRAMTAFRYRRQGPKFRPSKAVSMGDPPYELPGAARVALDEHGTLSSFFAVRDPAAPVDGTPDFGPLFEAARLDPALLREVEPTRAPDAYADQRHAWVGPVAEGGVVVHVHGSSIGEQVVSFDVLYPWDEGYDGAEPVPPFSRNSGVAEPYVLVPAVLLIIAGIAWQARRVQQRGEADVRGAARVATLVGVVGGVIRLLDPNLVSGNYVVLHTALLTVIGSALLTYWGYLTLEPFSRRFLPGAMTSWVRAVRGRFDDPLVARDVFVGATMGVVVVGLLRLGFVVEGIPSVQPLSSEAFSSVAAALRRLSGPLAGAPIQLLLFAGLVKLFGRRRRLASGVVIVGWAATLAIGAVGIGGGVAVGAALALGGALFGLALTRGGLLAFVVFLSCQNLVEAVALTADPERWYATSGYVAVAVVAGLIAYGWRYGVAGSESSPRPPNGSIRSVTG